MKTLEDARNLANRMIAIGKGVNRDVKVVLSNMDEPLGYNIGNANEIIEGIEALKGNWPKDLKEVVYTIASIALKSKGEIKELSEGKKLIDEVIENGKALEKLASFIKESGGNPEIVNDYSLLPTAKNMLEVRSLTSGYVAKIKTEEIGKAAMVIGAGRENKDSIIDHAVGLKAFKKVGDEVKEGEVIAHIYFNDDKKIKESERMILDAYEIVKEKVENLKPILDIIE